MVAWTQYRQHCNNRSWRGLIGSAQRARSHAAQDIERRRISPMHIFKCQHRRLSSRAGHYQLPAP